MSDEIVTIKLQGKSYPLRCPTTQVAELEQAGRYLDSKLEEIRRTCTNQDSERVALLAAINIAHELLLQKQQQSNEHISSSQKIKQLQTQIQQIVKQ